MKKILSRTFWVLVWVFVVLGIYALFYHPEWLIMGRVSATPQTFTHENCQYPERWTNPIDGCDNSDPAVPECIKAMYSQQAEKDCIDAFVKANTPEVQQPISLPKETQIEPIKECGK